MVKAFGLSNTPDACHFGREYPATGQHHMQAAATCFSRLGYFVKREGGGLTEALLGRIHLWGQ
jgi:hypothetical protein